MSARGIGGAVIGLIGIALVIMAVGLQTCRWVAPGEDVKSAIEQGDTAWADGREFKCTKKVDGGGGLFMLAVGIVGVAGGVYLLWAATKSARSTTPAKKPSAFLLAPLLVQDSSLVGSNAEGWQGGVLTFLLIAAVLAIIVGVVLYGRKRAADKKAGRR